MIRNVLAAILFLLSGGLISQELSDSIKKRVQLNVIVENINCAGEISDSTVITYLKYVDQIPIEILDSVSIKDLVFMKVGFPILKEMDKEKIINFFDSSDVKVIEDYGVTYWNCCFNGYLVYDTKTNDLYKLYGFMNSDLIKLIDDLKSKDIIRNKKEFLRRTDNNNLHEIKFKFIFDNLNNIHKYSVYNEIRVMDIQLKNGKEQTKIIR